jgi:hypothetical protein
VTDRNIIVSFQGVDRSLCANGDYDNIEYGAVSSSQLCGIFEKLLPQTPPEGDDVCPIGVYVESPGDSIGFSIDSGRLIDNESGKECTVEEAVERAMKAAAALSRSHPAGRPAKAFPRFDREAFFLGCGTGTVTIAVGLLIIWGTLTAPSGASKSTGFTTAQRLARLLPESVQQKIALVMAVLFVLFGLVCVVMGLGAVVNYLVAILTCRPGKKSPGKHVS